MGTINASGSALDHARSTWSSDKKTKLTFADLRMEPGGLCETAGYEGEFASVRRPIAWTKGTFVLMTLQKRLELQMLPKALRNVRQACARAWTKR